MKKFLASLLTVFILVSFVGCSGNADNDKNNSADKDDNSPKNATSEKVKYTDEQILFYAQDRCDIEDDRYTVYSYNYKGELLDSSEDAAYIGYYAENGLAPAYDRNSDKVGYIDKEGVFQIEPKYEDGSSFSKDGIALVKIEIEEDGVYSEKCGYINSKGEEITPCIYDDATSFYNCGYAIAKTNDLYEFTGETLKSSSTYYVIDNKGNQVIKTSYKIGSAEEKDSQKIVAVYDNYFVCETNNRYVIFDYSNNKLYEQTETEYLVLSKDYVLKHTYETTDENNYTVIKERFDGKKFTKEKTEYEITSKRVATTQSGLGYGIVANGKTVVPFEYDEIHQYGEYFVAIKYTGDDKYFDQMFDIYDKNYDKTAENIEYAFSDRSDIYGSKCQLPNGYFQIIIDDSDYEWLNGIIDYTGKIIVEPVYGRGINLNTYEGTGVFW